MFAHRKRLHLKMRQIPGCPDCTRRQNYLSAKKSSDLMKKAGGTEIRQPLLVARPTVDSGKQLLQQLYSLVRRFIVRIGAAATSSESRGCLLDFTQCKV